MDRHALAWLRWSGIAGVVGSLGYMIGDVLLIGNSATAAEFPHLSAFADNLLIQRSAIFLNSSTARLAAGGLAGVFSTPLYLAGTWHIFEASRPGGTRWSLPPFLLLVTAFSIAPFVHGSFFYVAEVLKAVGQVEPRAQPTLIALATRLTMWLFIAYGVLVVPALIGFTWFTVAIARGKTLYPRWAAFANPLVCMVTASVADRVLPPPLALLLSGAGLSLGMLVFFAMSTVLLWNPPPSPARPSSPD